MMNTRLKPVLLALSMAVAAVPSQNNAAEAPVAATNAVVSFIAQHEALITFMGVWFAIHTRLKTRKKEDFKTEQFQTDVAELLDSLNVFNPKLYKQLLFMFDKYMIGLPLKLEDGTKRTKDIEKDEINTVKCKVLTQKPFGAYGLFEAYVLLQMKPFTEYVPVMAAFYVMMTSPNMHFGNAVQTVHGTPKASK